MRYRVIPDIRVFSSMPVVVHEIQERRWYGWRTVGAVMTPEQADAAIRNLEESRKKKG